MTDKEKVENCYRLLHIKCECCKHKYNCREYLNTMSEHDMDVRVLFNLAYPQFKEIAKKHNTYESFVSYLESIDSFKVINYMNEIDKKELWRLSSEEERVN